MEADNVMANTTFRIKTNEQNQYEKKILVKLDRSELEDKYLRLYEEHIDLKKISSGQTDKIKRLGTKLLRLVNDKKNQDNALAERRKDVQLEEIIQDLQDENRDLKRQYKQIKEKLLVTKQQLATRPKARPSPYQHIQSRVDSGKNKNLSPYDAISPSPGAREAKRTGATSPLPKYGLSLLEESRAENRNLEELVQTLREHVYMLEQDNESILEQMRMKDVEYNEELSNLKSQMSSGQKKNIQGNVEMIRLQRELKQKLSQLGVLEEERNSAVQKMEVLKSGNEELMSDMENLNVQVQELQKKNLELESQAKDKVSLERSIQQGQEQVNELKRENVVLKDVNDKLMNSSLDTKPSRDDNAVEQALRSQINKLQQIIAGNNEETQQFLPPSVTTHVTVPHEVKDQKLEKEYKELLAINEKLKNENEEMNEKLKILSESSVVNMSDLENALTVVKMKKTGDVVEADNETSVHKKLSTLEAENVETANELEKTRNMLILQHRINRDYRAEVEAINSQKGQQKCEYETRLQEFAKLLDIRAARIHKLERQLKDIAYGTKQYQIADDDVEESVPLERGQNLLELHVDKVTISADGMHVLQDREPSSFLTWNFYDYQTVSTAIVRGSRPEFNHTSQYVVRADDAFLEYVLRMKTEVEFHVATGMDYVTVANGQIDLKPILDDTQSRYHGKAQLIGTNEADEKFVVGTLEYWVRLRIPMEQAVRLFKERGKALGYISTNYNTAKSALSILDGRTEEDEGGATTNELHIKITRCNDLVASREDRQPSPFCVYAFFNSPDHDTAIITASNNPEFNDHNIITVAIDEQLDDFLKTKSLQIYVFDDADRNVNSYIGVAEVPLISLVRNDGVDGTFQIISEDDAEKGTMDVGIYFRYSYLPPPGCHPPPMEDKKTVQDVLAEAEDQIPENDELPLDTIIAGHSKTVAPPTPPPRNRDSGPVAASTPVASRTPSEDKPQPSSRALRFSEAVKSSSSPQKMPRPEAAPRRSSLKSKDDPEIPSPKKSESRKSSISSPDESVDGNKMAEELSDDGSVDSLKEELKDEEAASPARISKKESMSTSESDDIVVKNPDAESRPPNSDVITIAVHHFSLTDDSIVHQNDNIQMLFVEYKFLNFMPEELETPFALPKPKPGQRISFHFSKAFRVDAKNNYSKRQMLAAMILPETADDIHFTVVSEPPDDRQEEMDCEDVGSVKVSLKQILKSGDVQEQDFEVCNTDGIKIGYLNLTIEAADVLRTIKSEIKAAS